MVNTLPPNVNTYGDLTIPEIQDFKSYLPNAFDDNLTLLQKVNMVIQTLTSMGVSVNSLFDNWNNVVVPYVTGDGLTNAVDNEITTLINNGTIDTIINHTIFNDLTNKVDDKGVDIKRNYGTLVVPTVNTFNIDIDKLNADLLNNKGTYLLSDGQYIITKPLLVPYGNNIIGHGMLSTIVPDYSQWIGTDYRAMIIQGREGNSYNNEFNPIIKNFNIAGKNQTGIKATGLFIGTDQAINSTDAVNFSFINGTIQNILVSKFDLAYNIKECWDSSLTNLQSTDCREGLQLIGKTVNVDFHVKLTNFSNLYTTDKTTATNGITIDSKLDYKDGEGRPEGISIREGSLVFGAKTNLNIQRCLQLTINKAIIDGATGNAIEINDPDSVTIDGCYIYASGQTNLCINFQGNNPQSLINIINNNFLSDQTSDNAISNMIGTRTGVRIEGNTFQGFKTPITINYLNDSFILNNRGLNNRGNFIYVQSACSGTIIDGNTSNDSFNIITLQPSTSTDIIIGKNKSANSTTHKKGKVTLTSNSVNVTTPNIFGNLLNTTDNVGAFVQYSIYNTYMETGERIRMRQANNAIIFECEAIIPHDIVIYYEGFAVPYSEI